MENFGITVIILTAVCAMVTLIFIAISKAAIAREKDGILNQIGILTDEVDRQKRENIALRAELKKVNSQDNLFFSSVIRLGSMLDVREIAREITGFLSHYLNAPEVAVFMLDEKGKRLNVIAQHGLNDNWLPKIVYNLGEGKVGATAEKRIPLGQREFEMLRISEPFPVFSPSACYPLVHQNKIFGVVAVTRLSDFEEREKNLLGVVASIGGVALHNTLSFSSLQDVASTDALTKLYNVAYFKDRLADELNRARRFQHDLTISILDLDNFKNYNDSYGHQAGDNLLIQLAQIFTKRFRDTDLVSRYGGDEFIVMFPETKKTDAAKLMSALLGELALYDFTRGDTKVRVTFSAGVASFPEDGSTPADLIKSADKALYEAKDAGRNAVRIHFHKIEKI